LRPGRREARVADLPDRARPARRGPDAGSRRQARCRPGRGRGGGAGRGDRAHRRGNRGRGEGRERPRAGGGRRRSSLARGRLVSGEATRGERDTDEPRIFALIVNPAAGGGRAGRALDLGEAAGRTFVGVASCGFDSVANRIANETRIVRGNLVYAYGAIRALIGWRPACFEVTFDDGRKHDVTGYSVGAANSKAYGGGMYVAPGAELDDGLLDIVTCADMPKRRFLTSLMPKLFDGTYVNLPEVTVLRAAEVTIAADRQFTMYA